MYVLNPEILPTLTYYCTITRAGGWGHDFVEKPQHLLILLNQGKLSITYGGKTYKMVNDSVLFIPKNTPYSASSEGTIEHQVVYFDAEICEEQMESINLTTRVSFPQYMISDVACRMQMQRAVKVSVDDAISSVERRVALLYALLSMSRAHENAGEGRLVKGMKQYLQEHFREKVTLEDLSREFGYTKQYLMRLFRRESGKSPIAYLNEIKLLRSTAELANEEKSIAEVAESCGFDDYNYYSRAFRRLYGMSPSKYRKSMIFMK